MRAASYEANGPAAQVLRLGDLPTPEPGAGEVRVRLATSGVNPSDVKSREGRTRKIAFPRVIPHRKAGSHAHRSDRRSSPDAARPCPTRSRRRPVP